MVHFHVQTHFINLIELRMAKTLWSFGHSVCNRVNIIYKDNMKNCAALQIGVLTGKLLCKERYSKCKKKKIHSVVSWLSRVHPAQLEYCSSPNGQKLTMYNMSRMKGSCFCSGTALQC